MAVDKEKDTKDLDKEAAGSETLEETSTPSTLREKIGGIGRAMARHLPDARPEPTKKYAELRNYVGACDVYSPEEAQAMADTLRKNREYSDRKVMIGVMTHPLVLRDDLPVPKDVIDGVRAEFPSREKMASGFIDDPDVFNTVHYADFYGKDGPWKGGECPDVFENLELIVEYGGENLHAIQLDLTWPKPEEIIRFHSAHPDIALVLQVGKFALEEVGYDPLKIVERLTEYKDSVDYILLDGSIGKGKGMRPEDLLPILRTIEDQLPHLGLAIAGGLGPESIELLAPIVAEFPGISIDAQGNLKPKGSPTDPHGHLIATEPADLGRTEDYIVQSCKVLDKPGVRRAGVPIPEED